MEGGSCRAAAASVILSVWTSSSSRSWRGCRPSRSASASASCGPGAPSSPIRPTAAGSRRRCRASSSPVPTTAARPGTSLACPCLRFCHHLPGLIRLSPSCPRPVSCWTLATGLLVLRSVEYRQRALPPPFYIVCNPATGEWVTLPQPSYVPGYLDHSDGVNLPIDTSTAALGFDPSISPHFHVFQLVQEMNCPEFMVWAVEIYSSQTGRWVLREAPFDSDIDYVQYTGQITYFKGFLHFCMIHNSVVSLDTKGQKWRISRVRQNGGGSGSSVCHSQGRLLYVDSNLGSSDAMPIYVLEDLDSEEWTWIFKQNINKPDLFGPRMQVRVWDYYTAAFHPDNNLIFFYDWGKKKLVSYDMKHGDVHVICTLEVPYFEFLPTEDVYRKFFPYVPLYSGALPSSSLS